MARLLERALRSDGHSVVLAFNGEQALISGRSPDLDVILLDVMMPLMDGFTVLSNLRAERLSTPTYCSPRAMPWRMWCAAWTWAPMTTSPSPLLWIYCWRECAP